jgi:hypothetical protein
MKINPTTTPRLVWSAAIVLLTLQAACWCGDITRVASVQPSAVARDAPTTVEIRFEEPVLPQDAEGDVRVLLYEPSTGYSIADYQGGEDRYGVITDLEATGEDSLSFELHIPAEHPPGSYRLHVSYNVGGGCDLAGDQLDLTVE